MASIPHARQCWLGQCATMAGRYGPAVPVSFALLLFPGGGGMGVLG